MNFNQTRTAANVKARSLTLFADGYNAEKIALSDRDAIVIIHSPNIANTYVIDVPAYSCTCPYFEQKQTACKHLLGYAKLLLEQDANACEMDVESYLRAMEQYGEVQYA